MSDSVLYFHAVKSTIGKHESKESDMGGKPLKQMNYLKQFLPWQCEFDHRYACWAANHRGWAKCKKTNKRLAKERERRAWKKEVRDGSYDG